MLTRWPDSEAELDDSLRPPPILPLGVAITFVVSLVAIATPLYLLTGDPVAVWGAFLLSVGVAFATHGLFYQVRNVEFGPADVRFKHGVFETRRSLNHAEISAITRHHMPGNWGAWRIVSGKETLLVSERDEEINSRLIALREVISPGRPVWEGAYYDGQPFNPRVLVLILYVLSLSCPIIAAYGMPMDNRVTWTFGILVGLGFPFIVYRTALLPSCLCRIVLVGNRVLQFDELGQLTRETDLGDCPSLVQYLSAVNGPPCEYAELVRVIKTLPGSS